MIIFGDFSQVLGHFFISKMINFRYFLGALVLFPKSLGRLKSGKT